MATEELPPAEEVAAEEVPVAEELPPAEEIEEPGGSPGAVEAAEAPADEALPAAEEVEEHAAGEAESDEDAAVEFDTNVADSTAGGAPAVRHVKVSSSLDILAELESLRKAATTHPAPREGGRPVASLDIDSILQSSLNSRQEVKRRVEEEVGDALMRARRCVVRVELTDAGGQTVTEVEPVDVELKKGEALRHFALTLTVHLKGQ